MKREDVIRMAQEVLLLDLRDDPNNDGIAQFIGTLSDFAALVAAAEREACARVCDALAAHPEYASEITKLAAHAIRARSKA
jgi:hypothetical protein